MIHIWRANREKLFGTFQDARAATKAGGIHFRDSRSARC